MGKKEDRAKLIEDSASIENFNELAGELEEFLKDRINTLGKVISRLDGLVGVNINNDNSASSSNLVLRHPFNENIRLSLGIIYSTLIIS